MVENFFAASTSPDYHDILENLGCLTDKFRGSGFKTALAAQALSLLHSPEKTPDALIQSANELESDTDTIATMAGALLGALKQEEPTWEIQDIEYLKSEAQRMASIACGARVSSFSYPDVSVWDPPTNHSDAVVMWEGDFALAGIGKLKPQGQEYNAGSAVWQWFKLPFGQSVLAKRRSIIRTSVSKDQMPREPLIPKLAKEKMENPDKQNTFSFFKMKEREKEQKIYNDASQARKKERFPGIDEATNIVIASGFDDSTIGHIINQCIETTGSIEQTVSLSAIIAKARLARMRRR